MLTNEPEKAAAPSYLEAGFDTAPVTVTVIPAPAPATEETGADLGGTPTPDQPPARTVNISGQDPNADLEGRVAALLPRKSTTDWNAVSAFMSGVVPWPQPQEPGYVNLHYSMPNPKPTPAKLLLKGMGWPFRTSEDLVNRAAWINTVPDKFKDVWFCTSRQSAHGVNTKGKPKAIRRAANAIKQKAIWVDVDVDSDPKHYGTVEEALKAVLLFASRVGLP